MGQFYPNFTKKYQYPSLCPLLSPSSRMGDAWEERVVMASMRKRVCVAIWERKYFRCQKNLSQFSHFLMKSIHPMHRNRNTSFFGCDTASPAPVCCLVFTWRGNRECSITWKSHTSLGIKVCNHWSEKLFGTTLTWFCCLENSLCSALLQGVVHILMHTTLANAMFFICVVYSDT